MEPISALYPTGGDHDALAWPAYLTLFCRESDERPSLPRRKKRSRLG